MSDIAVDQLEGGDESPSDSQGTEIARYTIYVPVRNNQQREIPHVLHEVRQALTNMGLSGRTVIRKAQGDWQGDAQYYETEEMDLVMVDAPDTPGVLSQIKQAAQLAKELAEQEAVYLTVQPLKTFIV